MSVPNKDNDIIVKDVHCPYCDTDGAVLINRTESKKVSLQLPAFGLKYILCMIYLPIIYIFMQGFKLIEAKKEINNITYAFCPQCGNVYSMAAPETIKEEIQEPKLHKVFDGRLVMGLCKGISEFTGVPLIWVRIMTVIYGLTGIGLFLYLIVGICLPFKDEDNREFLRVYDRKLIMGVCTGFAKYIDRPLWVVRLFTIILILPLILYFVLAFIIPKEKSYGK